MSTKHWKETVAQKRLERAASIPKEWILTSLPSEDTLNVIDFPEKCGLLTASDIEITNTEVIILLEKLAKGTWSAVEVTTAFSKRAIIAQQLVRFRALNAHLQFLMMDIGQLSHRNLYRPGFGACC